MLFHDIFYLTFFLSYLTTTGSVSLQFCYFRFNCQTKTVFCSVLQIVKITLQMKNIFFYYSFSHFFFCWSCNGAMFFIRFFFFHFIQLYFVHCWKSFYFFNTPTSFYLHCFYFVIGLHRLYFIKFLLWIGTNKNKNEEPQASTQNIYIHTHNAGEMKVN